MILVGEKHFHECISIHNSPFVPNQRATNVRKFYYTTADGRHKQNLFCLLEAPQTLYIGLTIKVADSVHMMCI